MLCAIVMFISLSVAKTIYKTSNRVHCMDYL